MPGTAGGPWGLSVAPSLVELVGKTLPQVAFDRPMDDQFMCDFCHSLRVSGLTIIMRNIYPALVCQALGLALHIYFPTKS